MDGRCGTCRHWDAPTPESRRPDAPLRLCSRLGVRASTEHRDDVPRLIGVHFPPAERGPSVGAVDVVIDTTADFGCVLWEGRG